MCEAFSPQLNRMEVGEKASVPALGTCNLTPSLSAQRARFKTGPVEPHPKL